VRKWGFRVKLYWCDNCNTPLRQKFCSRCGSKGRKLTVTEPGDIRPAFSGDLQIIRESILTEFGTDVLLKRLNISVGSTFVNKVPHYDDMKSVIVSGVVVGRFFFDPKIMKWRWRLNSYSARLAVEYGLVKVFVRSKVKPLEALGEGANSGEQAVVTDPEGNVVALAIAKKGRFRVQTLLRDPGDWEISKKSATFDDIIKCNDEYFRSLISRSVQHLALFSSKVRLPIISSFSGGKDSLVSLHLAVQAGLEPAILFNNTGLELPPTVDYVELITSKYGLRLLLADAGDAFWKSVDVFGPPAKDYRWCCKVLKLARIARVYKEQYPDGALVIVGQRALESVDRSWSGRVWRNKWLPSVLNTSPIQEWDQLMIWMYIFRNKLPYNTLYEKGFDRIGCYLCPVANIAEYYIVSTHYPELWGRWAEVLQAWKSRLNVGEEWLRYHLWRWLNPEAQGRRRLEIWLGIKKPSHPATEYSRRLGHLVRVSAKSSDYVELILQVKVPVNVLENQAKVLGCSVTEKDVNYISLRCCDAIVQFDGAKLLVVGKECYAVASDVLKVLVRWLLCVGCGSCLMWCPNSAVRPVNRKPLVDTLRCSSCGICLEICPVADLLVKRIVLPVVFSGSELNRIVRSSNEILKAVRYYRGLRKVSISESGESEPVYTGISQFFKSVELKDN